MEVKKHKYFLVFLITLGIFAVIYLASEFLYSQRISSVKAIEDTINRSILESEIQYSLLADATCGEEESNPILIDEINALAKRLDVMETQRGATDPEVISLKKYYSLLQVRDYLFLRERAKQCNEHPATVIYFYSNTGNCDDCKKMGFVLTSMREEFSALHIYAFDYNLGLSVIETLKSIYKLEDQFPVLVINRKAYYGFKTREQVLDLLPEIKFATTSSATTTKKK
jgi:hypothetical protein